MKSPLTTFNGWILSKINTYLKISEGCTIETSNYTNDGARTIVQDSFGFRYEIQIKTLGRIYHDDNETSMDRYSALSNKTFLE